MAGFDEAIVGKMHAEYGWAVEIIRQHFSDGLADICDEKFLHERYRRFQAKQDPIYSELLKGMKDEALSITFVSYWTIAQTLATQSRFWLEDAIAEIILEQVRNRKRETLEVYSTKMLGAGYFAQRRPVAELGEDELEHLSGRSPWRVPLKSRALDEVDLIVGKQERERPPERKPFAPRMWTNEQDIAAKVADAAFQQQIAATIGDDPTSEINLQCNLLVVDPNKVAHTPCVHGFRFINPKTLSNHATRKQERVNLLRLYGYLVQEKVYNDPNTIRVCVAELLPRYGDFETSDHYPDYFSSDTYWTCERLWRFIGVPYEVVSVAIWAVSQDFEERLRKGLRGLLPSQNKTGPSSLFGS